MSQNREDDAQEGGARIEELPASDSEVAGEGQVGRQPGVAAPPPDPRDPEDPDGARRSSPPPEPMDPEG